MKKILVVIIAIALISLGIVGFIYLAKIDGSGPELSWGLGMGPLLVGLFILMSTTLRKEDNNANTLP